MEVATRSEGEQPGVEEDLALSSSERSDPQGAPLGCQEEGDQPIPSVCRQGWAERKDRVSPETTSPLTGKGALVAQGRWDVWGD